ncbi:probable disease resistance protein At4g27220 isoform X2 [Pistacia vera]|uniref:probable disease resistance protein At4g27220 isoform X2 n=1 Tax=Pistacia vera TaxID=55513 RepID=UPI0012636385|nr:probable disease resistance protein At4g27220 isoform X2 [Pistacia vera]
MADIASFVLDVVKCLAAPVGRQFMYLYNYKKNIDNLQGEVRKLKNTREEVQVKVTAAERNAEVIKQNVKDWQTDVERTITEAEQLIPEEGNSPRCFKGLCPNWITRYKHGKKAFKLKENDISQFLDKNNFPFLRLEDNVGHPTISQEIWLRSTKDYVALESRTSTEKNVWEALNDESIYMIGVYGMGGLGKTTLVQGVGRKAMEEQLFDEVVLIEVTGTPNIETIQSKIAQKLGLKLDKESDVADKANKLYERLKMTKKGQKDEKGKEDEKDMRPVEMNKKDEQDEKGDKGDEGKKDEKDMRPVKILLILDNIWEDLDLDAVGIPSKDDRGGCKLLLTTRKLEVLNSMNSSKNFKMGTLKEEEAWSLFQKMAGGVIQNRELNSLAQDVCKECGGLPIVICTVAKALKSKRRPSDWKVALQDLKAPSPAKFMGVLEKEYMNIALSYKYLRDDELKKTFLISSLMKNNTSISDFFIHVVGLDILEGANLKMEEARDRLDTLVRDLKDSCLLTDGFTSEQFAMHDVVRAVAVTVSYTDHHVFTGRNDVEREWKDKDKLKKCTKISLTDSSTVISKLWPNDLDCPNLEYFSMTNMWGFHSSFEIPKDFFTVMPKLKTLILCGMHQSSLPSSLDLLTNLRTLCLNDSNIEDVAIIGKLKRLKVLSLRNSSINELPIELGQLTQLRLLDLNYCWQLKVIVPNVISKLSQLEELYIRGCCIQWKVEVLEELKLLSQLASLELDIKDSKMLAKDFFSKELKRYKISVGDFSSLSGGDWLSLPKLSSQFSRYNEDVGLRMFKLKLNSTISLEELQGIRNVEHLVCFSDVENCLNDFVTLMPLFNEKVIFTNLKALELKYISCGKIWDNKFATLMSSSYQNLTCFILGKCGKIKYVFPSSVAKNLQTLQRLEIMDCEVLEEIVAEEEGAKAVFNFAFPQVTYLQLEKLPNLTAFYHGIHTCELPMLKGLVINECEKFTSKYLSFQENSFHISEPKSLYLKHKINHDLEVLELRNGGKGIIWQSQSKALTIKGDELANNPLQHFQRFENMNKLKLSGCDQIKELFFPNLPNLEVLDVQDCSELIYLASSSTSFQNLKALTVDNCHELMKLITPSTARLFILTRCGKIKYAFPSSVAKSLHTLQRLEIMDCEVLEEIVAEEEGAKAAFNFAFPQITYLQLEKLPNLTAFYPGIHTCELPMLKGLVINECEKFTSKCLSFQENSFHIPELKSLCLEHKINSNLEDLYLKNKERQITWRSRFKTLEIIHDESANISFGLLQRFEKMEVLKLITCRYEEMFSCGKDEKHMQITRRPS